MEIPIFSPAFIRPHLPQRSTTKLYLTKAATTPAARVIAVLAFTTKLRNLSEARVNRLAYYSKSITLERRPRHLSFLISKPQLVHIRHHIQVSTHYAASFPSSGKGEGSLDCSRSHVWLCHKGGKSFTMVTSYSRCS